MADQPTGSITARNREWPHWVLIIAMFGLAAYAWPNVPQRMPIHWNAAGEADGWGHRAVGLLFLPILAIGLYALLKFIPRLDPEKASDPSFARPYGMMRLATTAFMAVLYAATVADALGMGMSAGRMAMPLTGALLIFAGVLIADVPQNGVMGVRTPWTLSSERAWKQTNRLGRWVLIAGGVAFVAAGLVGGAKATWFAIGVTVFGSVALVPYSFVVSRGGSDGGETTPQS